MGRVFGQTEGASSSEGCGPDDDFGDGVSFTWNKVIDSGDDLVLVLCPEFLSGGEIKLRGRQEFDDGIEEVGRDGERQVSDVEAGGLIPEAGNGEIG